MADEKSRGWRPGFVGLHKSLWTEVVWRMSFCKQEHFVPEGTALSSASVKRPPSDA